MCMTRLTARRRKTIDGTMKPKTSNVFSQQRGIGMIEILISIVVLSIGFLAAAQMQVQGLRYNQSAYFESQAYFMMSNMVERMRANPEGVKDGDYSNKTTSANAVNPNCMTKACSTSEQAQQDLYDWSANLYNLEGSTHFIAALGSSDTTNASGSITAGASGSYTITITWAELVGNDYMDESRSVDFIP